MPKADGHLTKERILQVAEKLFSEKGFDGTGVDEIAKTTGINKGSIYYHFKDKNDIVESLFKNVMSDLEEHIETDVVMKTEDVTHVKLNDKIRTEIEYLDQRKQALSVLFMETLKSNNTTDTFFECAQVLINKELSNMVSKEKIESLSEEEMNQYIVHEFFTGIIPVISMVILKEKWCKYFGYDEEKLMTYFMKAFFQSHLKSHTFRFDEAEK